MKKVSVVFRKQASVPGQVPVRTGTPYDRRSGFYGIVTEVHPEDLTVNVRTDTGRVLSGVRVASRQWVTMDDGKDWLTGERKLPPVNSFVLCLMPTGDPASAVVLCSVFACQDSMNGGISAFKDDSEDAKFTDRKADSGGWLFTHDRRTGTRRIGNAPVPGDQTIFLEVDQEEEGREKARLSVHGTVIEIDNENGIKIATDKNADVEADGDVNINVSGNAGLNVGGNLKAEATGNAEVKGANVTVEASASLVLKTGDAAAFVPNIIPTCPFGIPHGGKAAGIVKLCGA